MSSSACCETITTQSISIELHQTFNSRQELKYAIERLAVRNNFETTTVRADLRRYQVKCKAKHCPWLLKASPVSQSTLWRIIEFDSTHNCVGVTGTDNSTASAKFIATAMLEKIRTQPDLRPIHMQKDFHREFGIEVPYHRILEAKEHALTMINGTHEESYTKLPQYCEDLLKANPGSLIEYEKTETNQFFRLFLSFNASAKRIRRVQTSSRPRWNSPSKQISGRVTHSNRYGRAGTAISFRICCYSDRRYRKLELVSHKTAKSP
jgi:hypothetical protein